MFAWQIAFALELLVILVGFIVLLKAANAVAGPRLFAQIVAVIVILVATGLAGCTITKAILYHLRAGDQKVEYVTYVPPPAPKPTPAPTPPTTAPAPPKKPVAEWEGDLMKKKWDERGDMMKKKWAERGDK